MPLYKNVDSAPFHIGDRVKVLNNPNNDETFDTQFAFKSGVIVYFEYECGCGQDFPEDPMIGVRFKTGIVEEFWKEEIKTID
jgi:hypothetical protein